MMLRMCVKGGGGGGVCVVGRSDVSINILSINHDTLRYPDSENNNNGAIMSQFVLC
jgi:hypothetical protein